MTLKQMRIKSEKYMKRKKMPDRQRIWAALLREAYREWDRVAEGSLLDSYEAQAKAVMEALAGKYSIKKNANGTFNIKRIKDDSKHRNK